MVGFMLNYIRARTLEVGILSWNQDICHNLNIGVQVWVT
jgi:hypothetical protein